MNRTRGALGAHLIADEDQLHRLRMVAAGAQPSTDVDLFAAASADFDFTDAVDTVIAAFEQDGARG